MVGPEDISSEAGQAEIVAFLSDPATHRGAAVERVDTHISRIFLAGDRAWKLKRAVRTNYLDFTTKAERERSCRREIEVNRNAPEIYLGVRPIVRTESGFGIGGLGEPVDWLVEMRRFDRSQELDRLCDRGGLTLRMIESLADAVAAMHDSAPVTPGFGNGGDVSARIEQIAAALASVAGGSGLAKDGEAWRSTAHATCAALAARLDRRCRLGRVRRCHGDLHLGNIVLIDGRPTPFDAIEFNEAIASIDVLYDLALTLADLRMRNEKAFANALMNRYLGATRDYSGLDLLPLYVSLRGAVKAMTAASSGAREEAAGNLAFARWSLGAEQAPRLVAVGGISGTGKSTVARTLAPRLAEPAGAVVIRSDVVRKRLAGALPEVRLPAEAYTPGMDRKVLARMAWDARTALRARATVILDATFLAPEGRDCAERLAALDARRFDGIWLEAPVEEAARRVEARAGDASDATSLVVRRQAVSRGGAPQGWTALPASHPLPEVVAAAEQAIGRPQNRR